MARIKFKDFVPRPKPKKRPRRHAKSVSKRIPNKKIQRSRKMKIDGKYILGILGAILMSLSTWTLLSVVELKEDTGLIKGELLGVNKDISRIYGNFQRK